MGHQAQQQMIQEIDYCYQIDAFNTSALNSSASNSSAILFAFAQEGIATPLLLPAIRALLEGMRALHKKRTAPK